MISPALLEIRAHAEKIIIEYEEFIRSKVTTSQDAISVALYRKTKDARHLTSFQNDVVKFLRDPNNPSASLSLSPEIQAQAKDKATGILDVAKDKVNKEIEKLQDAVKSNLTPDIDLPGQDTWDKIMDYAKDRGNSLKWDNIKENCIPCLDRDWALFKELGDWKKLGKDLVKAMLAPFLKWYEDMKAMIQKLKSLLNNDFWKFNICRLLELLKDLFMGHFNCIPDFMAILAALSFLMFQLANSLNIGMASLGMALLSTLLAPLFFKISAWLKSILDKLTAPLECIINSIDLQLSKLPEFKLKSLDVMFKGTPETASREAEVITAGSVTMAQRTSADGQIRRAEQDMREKQARDLAEKAKNNPAPPEPKEDYSNWEKKSEAAFHQKLIDRINMPQRAENLTQTNKAATQRMVDDWAVLSETSMDNVASILWVVRDAIKTSKESIVTYVASLERMLADIQSSLKSQLEEDYKILTTIQRIISLITLLKTLKEIWDKGLKFCDKDKSDISNEEIANELVKKGYFIEGGTSNRNNPISVEELYSPESKINWTPIDNSSSPEEFSPPTEEEIRDGLATDGQIDLTTGLKLKVVTNPSGFSSYQLVVNPKTFKCTGSLSKSEFAELRQMMSELQGVK